LKNNFLLKNLKHNNLSKIQQNTEKITAKSSKKVFFLGFSSSKQFNNI